MRGRVVGVEAKVRHIQRRKVRVADEASVARAEPVLAAGQYGALELLRPRVRDIAQD